MKKTYEAKKYEEKIYRLWQRSGFFNPDNLPRIHADRDADKRRYIRMNQRKHPRKSAFTIVIPPPNVTGSLHMGHALNNTIQDILIRFYRMNGYQALWIPGLDHAGIATQNVVEKELKKEGLIRQELGREKFLKRIWQWVNKYGNLIIKQLKRLGCSCDWSRQRFTLDKEYIQAVETAFIHYYKKGLIYRGPRIVNWCPRCGTAISDIEVKYQPTKGKLWYIKYKLKTQNSKLKTDYIVVATTRPETMLGDTAVAINPKDKRYKNLVGQKVILPLMNREIPIITHHLVDPEFGTGAVKVTPAHDSTDWQIGKEKKLAVINVIGPEAKMTKEAGKYASLSTLEARKKIIEELKSLGLLEKEEEYRYNLALCDRCGTPIEPQISSQWFLKMKELAKPAVEVVKKGKIRIIPERYKKIYLNWLARIEDWCISRQLWWGHRLPVWHCQIKTPPDKKMGFHKDILYQVFKGKISTWRLRDHNFKPGDVVAFENSQSGEIFGYGTITKVIKTTVGKIDLKDKTYYKTYRNRKELIKAFKRHHPDREINKETPVFVYTYNFRKINASDGGCGKIIVSEKKPKKCPNCGATDFEQSADVLDTWFSSALWPFATLGWPKKTKDLKEYYPTNFLSTAQEILYLWVARMVFSSLEFTKKIPFKDVYIHPTVLAITGKRMSKSLGTGIDPLEIAEKYGVDSVRMGLIYQTNRDQQSFKFDERTILASRNFINKLWNIARFVQMRLTTSEFSRMRRIKNIKPITLADKWLLSRLNTIIDSTTKKIKNYQLGETIRELYDFSWHEFADWSIEISKFQTQNTKLKENTTCLIHYLLFNILKLFHPFIPFVTEAIYQQFNKLASKQFSNLLMVASWPKANKNLINKRAEKEFEKIKDLIIEIRNWREKRKVPANEICEYKIKKREKIIFTNQEIIEKLARAKLI